MAKYVPDVKTQRWVVISPARTSRPDDAIKGAAHPEVPQSGTKGCPFCVGNEYTTPPEVYRLGPGEKDKPGWIVRVVPNKFPITDIHEVFIHSTDHEKSIESLPVDQVVKILTSYRDRYRAHDNDGQILIFCNRGFQAGASLAHPHSQLVVVPKQINLDSLSREPINNVIEEGKYFHMYCPDFSQWPYEVWLSPKTEGGKYGDISDVEMKELGHMLQRALQKIEAVYKKSPIKPKDHAGDTFVYNYYIRHGDDWYLRIIPRFIHRAGFELGTGLNVNIVDPTLAAGELKNI